MSVIERTGYLVIGPTWVGDLIMAQCLFKALKRKRPDWRLDVTGQAWAMELLARMPEVDNAINVDIAHGRLGLGRRWRIGRQLRGQRYRQAFVSSRSLKSALIPWFAGVPQRTGYPGELRRGIVNDVRHQDAAVHKLKQQQYAALSLEPDEDPRHAVAIEQPSLAVDQGNRDRLLKQHGLRLRRPIVALAPGAAYGPAKRWPADRYAQVAGELADRGRDCWVFGTRADIDIGNTIAAAAPDDVVNFCGKTALADAVDLMSLAQTVVSNDSGLMHVGAAVVAHVIGLYGPTPPDHTPPLCDQAIQLWQPLERGPAKPRSRPLDHDESLVGVPVADVVRACIDSDDNTIPSRYERGGPDRS